MDDIKFSFNDLIDMGLADRIDERFVFRVKEALSNGEYISEEAAERIMRETVTELNETIQRGEIFA
jgi:hypothetical protein